MARMARAEVFAPDEVAVVHVMNRVVRRCYLMGNDPVSGKNYDHRKVMIELQLQRLAGAFGIDLLGFAIMSNHFHLILRSRPDVVATWDDTEVARRWLLICPVRKNSAGDPGVTGITYGEGATFEESLVAGGFSGSLQYLAAGGPLRFPKISGFSQGTSANRPLITTRSATSTPNLTSGRTHGVTNADRVGKDARSKVPPLDDLSKLGNAAGKGDLSKAGHSLSKHGAGKRPGSSAFPNPTGNPAQINQQAQNLLCLLYTSPSPRD